MAFADFLNASANIWRNLNADGATVDEFGDTPADWQLVSIEACRVTMAPPDPGRSDRGFGQALVALPRVSFLPTADVAPRDIIEIDTGPQAPLWLRDPEIKKAQGTQAVHHLVIEGQPTHTRPEELS